MADPSLEDFLRPEIERQYGSQREFCAKVGIQESHLSSILNGRMPNWHTLKKIFKALNYRLAHVDESKGKGARIKIV